MRRRHKIAVGLVVGWFALGLAHDAAARWDWIDVPYATVRCQGAAIDVAPSCMGQADRMSCRALFPAPDTSVYDTLDEPYVSSTL